MILTGILHLVFVVLINARAAFIALALFAWIVYIAMRVRKDSSLLTVWGFRRDRFRSAFIATSSIAGIAIAMMAVIAVSHGSALFHWHMLPLFLLYPVWGITQQFLIQGLVVRNLSRASGVVGTAWVVTTVSAALFAIVHLPDPTLAIGTFFLGLAFTPIYLKWRNLWPLGIYHGWLGVLVYFWILHRDPWLEVFGSL